MLLRVVVSHNDVAANKCCHSTVDFWVAATGCLARGVGSSVAERRFWAERGTELRRILQERTKKVEKAQDEDVDKSNVSGIPVA